MKKSDFIRFSMLEAIATIQNYEAHPVYLAG
jgi:hypothetical protein